MRDPDRPATIGKAELAACGAVGIVALALVALIWIVTFRTVQEQRAEILDRGEQALIGQASVIAETIGHELLLIDQSLTVLQTAWKLDSEAFDLTKWQQQMPALTAVADDLFISDDKHIIRQDILPQAIGQGIGTAYVTFPHGSLETYESDGARDAESAVLQGQTGAPVDARQFPMYILRPLDHPEGWLVGASFRSTELTRLFAEAALGYDPVVALVDNRRGVVQAVVGPSARHPNTDFSRTPLFAMLSRSSAGTWQGETAIDGVERIHAFHRVGDRDLTVVVAAAMAEVMAPADNLAAGARSLALIGSALVLLIGGLVLWKLSTARDHQRRQRVLDRNRIELERLRSDDGANAARAQISAARLQSVLEHTGDGIALFDANLRLVQWNPAFLRDIGVEPRPDMPLDTLLREQVTKGMFGDVSHTEVEVARRTGLLCSGDADGVAQPGPNHEHLVLRGLPIGEGGFMLLLNALSHRALAPPPALFTEADARATEVVMPAPIDW